MVFGLLRIYQGAMKKSQKSSASWSKTEKISIFLYFHDISPREKQRTPVPWSPSESLQILLEINEIRLENYFESYLSLVATFIFFIL
jgi:hypothetical protein